MVRRDLLFQVWFHIMTWLTPNLVHMKPGDSGVLIGYHIGEFTCPWSVEHFVAQSYVSWFNGQSIITNPLPACVV